MMRHPPVAAQRAFPVFVGPQNNPVIPSGARNLSSITTTSTRNVSSISLFSSTTLENFLTPSPTPRIPTFEEAIASPRSLEKVRGARHGKESQERSKAHEEKGQVGIKKEGRRDSQRPSPILFCFDSRRP
jgi:hypothetical protein